MAQLLKGAPVAQALTERIMVRTSALRSQGIVPQLAILRVGSRPEDMSYERGAIKRCAAAGVDVRSVNLSPDTSQQALEQTIRALNVDRAVHGILLLRPLPAPLDNEAARRILAPEKDVDGITDGSLAGVFTGSGQGFPPCTAQAVIELLQYYGIPMAGARAVVAGRSLVVGRPAAMLLMAQGATVTLCHSRTRDLAAETRRAEIFVAAIGKMGFFGADHVGPGAVVVDVGIHADQSTGKLRGDVLFEQAEPVAGAITPVPGGLGAVTTAVLAEHVARAAEIILDFPACSAYNV